MPVINRMMGARLMGMGKASTVGAVGGGVAGGVGASIAGENVGEGIVGGAVIGAVAGGALNVRSQIGQEGRRQVMAKNIAGLNAKKGTATGLFKGRKEAKLQQQIGAARNRYAKNRNFGRGGIAAGIIGGAAGLGYATLSSNQSKSFAQSSLSERLDYNRQLKNQNMEYDITTAMAKQKIYGR